MYGPSHDKPLRRLVEIRAQRVVGVINPRIGPDRLDDPEPLQAAFRDLLIAHEELRLQLVVVHPCGDSPRRTNVNVNLAAAKVSVMLCGFFKALAHLKPLHGLFELFYPIRLVFIADSFELYPFAGHFFRDGADHLAIFRLLRQRGQIRVAGKAIKVAVAVTAICSIEIIVRRGVHCQNGTFDSLGDDPFRRFVALKLSFR